MGTVYHPGPPYGVGAYAAPFPSYLNAPAQASGAQPGPSPSSSDSKAFCAAPPVRDSAAFPSSHAAGFSCAAASTAGPSVGSIKPETSPALAMPPTTSTDLAGFAAGTAATALYQPAAKSVHRPHQDPPPLAKSEHDPQPALQPAEPKKMGLETHSMVLPACISPNGGSLSDFVAQMTCFMTQEPWKIVADACQYTSGSPLPRQRLVPEAIAKPDLLKWTKNILATTQVTQNVVLLALLLIYRLKRNNQHLKGHYGSAYRLLTIALMLGNKFLDDNTYTNKTWADVSSISVHDIHHMEVEFLSNMRFSLFVREQQWSAWLKNMASMKAYYDEAARRISSPDPSVLIAAQPYLPPQPLPQPLHTHASHSPSRLSTAYVPSPAGSAQNQKHHVELSPSLSAGAMSRKRNYPDHDSPPDARKARRMSPSPTKSISPPDQMPMLPSHPANVPLTMPMAMGTAMPVPAQPSSSAAGSSASTSAHYSATPGAVARDSRRLTLPHLTVNTTPAALAPPVPTQQPAYVPSNNSQSAYPAMPPRAVPSSLPPTTTGSRPLATGPVAPSLATSAYAGPPPQNLMATPTFLPPSTSQLPSAGYVTPTKHQSPNTLNRYGFSPHGSQPDVYAGHQARLPTHAQNPGFNPSHSILTSMPHSPLSPSTQAATLRSGVPHSHPHPHPHSGHSHPHGHPAVSVSTPLDQPQGPGGHQRSPYPMLSPISYLSDRSSPYRPVRTVNTLMYPPGSTSLSEYHLIPQAITPNSMHWHRVGRPNDIRSGIVPEYRHM